MRNFFLILNFIFVLCFSGMARAENRISVKMRQYHLSCGYYSKTTSEIEFNFRAFSEENEGRWVLYYAWENEVGEGLNWQRDFMLGSNSHHLYLFLKKDIIQRGRSEYFKKIHFFFRKMEGEEVLEVFPDSIPFNHFTVSVQAEHSTNCLRSVDELPPFASVPISEI